MDALVIHINSDVVRTESPFNKDPMAMAVIALKRNSSAVRMESQQPQARTLKDVHALLANMDVVLMASPMRKDHNLTVALMYHHHHRKHVASARTAALAAITPLNTSSIWNMAAVLASGTADAVAMLIDLRQLKNVRVHVNSQVAKMLAEFQRFTAHAQDTIRSTTMIQIVISVPNSFMVAAWATLIGSKHWKNVRVNVLLTKICVRALQFHLFI